MICGGRARALGCLARPLIFAGIGWLLRLTRGCSRGMKGEAKDIRELLTKLADEYPGLEPWIDRGISVAIDGTVCVVEEAAAGEGLPP